jgi:hypothetical protein
VSVYQPLQSYLTERADASVMMTYAEIERLLGRRLPNTAYGDNKRQWWANTETHSQALAWLRANRKAKLDVHREEVTFIRQDDGPTHASDRDDRSIDLSGLQPAAIRLLEDMAEERGVTLSIAATDLLNQMARRRRQATLDWFEGKSAWSEVTSAELLREDRDAR